MIIGIRCCKTHTLDSFCKCNIFARCRFNECIINIFVIFSLKVIGRSLFPAIVTPSNPYCDIIFITIIGNRCLYERIGIRIKCCIIHCWRPFNIRQFIVFIVKSGSFQIKRIIGELVIHFFRAIQAICCIIHSSSRTICQRPWIWICISICMILEIINRILISSAKLCQSII